MAQGSARVVFWVSKKSHLHPHRSCSTRSHRCLISRLCHFRARALCPLFPSHGSTPWRSTLWRTVRSIGGTKSSHMIRSAWMFECCRTGWHLPLCPIILGRHRQSHHLSSRAPLASFRQRTDSLLLATLFGCVGSGSCQETQCSCLCAKITPILFLNLARREKRSDCATFWKFGSRRPLLRRNTHVFSHKSNCSITSGARQGNPTV